MNKLLSQDSNEFEAIWDKIKPQIYRICLRQMNDINDADDVFQETAIRIWRGISSFRHDSSVLTWAISITNREVDRALRKKINRINNNSILVSNSENESDEDWKSEQKVKSSVENYNWVNSIVELGKHTKTINDLEYKVVKAKLIYPQKQWQDISKLINASASRCAVEHSRAIPKLCVLLFIHYPEKLGGRKFLGNLLQKQLTADPAFMTAEETAAFKAIVVEESRKYTKAGWRTHLRAACSKMTKLISMP